MPRAEIGEMRVDTPVAPVPVAAARRRTISPWVIGAGAGVALIATAVTMSRNLAPVAAPTLAPAVVSEAKPSPEDAQLAAAPTAAGPETPAVADSSAQVPAPAATPAPVLGPPVTTVAAAPKPAKVEAPAPEVRTLSPKPEVLAQASPPPVSLNQAVPTVQAPAQPAVVPTPAPAMPPVVTPQATPAPLPPMAQQAPAADAEDTGITVKVRQALAADALLAAVPIAVSTDHGVVKLEGQAPDAQARDRATTVVASTLGVKGVDNRLTLPPVAQLQPEPGSAAVQGS